MKRVLIFLFSITLVSIIHAATIYVNVHNVNGNLVQGAYVKLYDSSWNVVSSSYTNSSGMVTFALLDYGMYNYEVYYSGDTQEFWGSEENISLQSPTLTSNFTRYWPYRYAYDLPPAEVYTNNEISFEVTVKNEVSFSRNVKVEIWVDRNQSSSWDFHQTSNAQSIISNSTNSFDFSFTPTSTGTYYWKTHILTWNDGAGDYIVTDSYYFSLAFIAVKETGDLSVTVKNVNSDNIENALVKLYEEDWDLFEEDYTNSSGEANFDNLDYGTYHYEVYYTGDVLEFWGGDENIVVNSSSESETFNRDWPYRYGYQQPPSSVDINTPVSYTIDVKNKLSYSRDVRVEIWLDKDQSESWDFYELSESKTIAGNSTESFVFNFTPTSSGTYYWKTHIKSWNDGAGEYIVTDSYLWSQAFVVVGNQPFPLDEGLLIFHNYSNYNAWDAKLFLYDFSTNNKTELGTDWNIDHEMNAHFSPNGSRIVFMGDDSGLPRDWDIYIWDFGSSGQPQNLTSNFNTRDEDPKFSPDGSSIVFKQNGDLKIMDLEGNIISEITSDGALVEESMPYFTTDGQKIVYAKGADSASDIYIINTDGSNNKSLFSITDLDEYFPIIKDNSSLFFTRWISPSNHYDQIYLGDFNGNSSSLSINDISSDNSDAYPVFDDYLFFSSTRNGSIGGYDIYFGQISSGEVWSLNEFSINSDLEDLGACFVIPSPTNDYLEVSISELNLGGEAGNSDIFNISSNINWNISESIDWFSVSQTQGSGDAEITVTTLDSNKTGSTREGLIVISGDGVQSKEITVYQESLSTSLDAPNLVLPANGSSMSDQTPYFEWGTVDGATDYQLQLDNNSDFSSPEIDQPLQENYYQVTNTLNYDSYNWRVKASNTTKGSDWSNIWTFNIQNSVSVPEKPINPIPDNNATNVSMNTSLSWTNGGGATGYKVYFGNNSEPGINEFKIEHTYTNYNPGSLSPNTLYYWRIDAVNEAGETTGDVWHFTTASSDSLPSKTINPNPANGETDVNINTDLSWENGGGATSYKIHLGTNTSPDYIKDHYSNSYSPGGLAYNTTYYWRIDAVNSIGTKTGDIWSFITEENPTDVDVSNSQIPTHYKLFDAYPNPFNPTTQIKYDLPKSGHVEIRVYDNLGREVTILVNEYKQAGSYEVEFDASNLSNGVYFYEIRAGDFRDVKKLVLLK